MAGWWATSAFRWLDSDLRQLWRILLPRAGSSLHFPGLNFSFSFSVVDDIVWPVVTAFESIALVSMLCFFFLFCGCTV